jgi:hypothetical protein
MTKNSFVLFLTIAILIIVIGCNRGIERVGIDGVVTLGGKPVEGCVVTILPQAGPGAIVETEADGTYKILKEAGPMPGECEIRVEKFNYRTEKGSDGRDSTITESALPETIQGKSKPFTLKSGNNKIDLNLDKW